MRKRQRGRLKFLGILGRHLRKVGPQIPIDLDGFGGLSKSASGDVCL